MAWPWVGPERVRRVAAKFRGLAATLLEPELVSRLGGPMKDLAGATVGVLATAAEDALGQAALLDLALGGEIAGQHNAGATDFQLLVGRHVGQRAEQLGAAVVHVRVVDQLVARDRGQFDRAREHARATHDEYDRVDWEIISVDTETLRLYEGNYVDEVGFELTVTDERWPETRLMPP